MKERVWVGRMGGVGGDGEWRRQKGRWDGRKHSGEGRNPSMAGMESPDKGRGGRGNAGKR